MTKFTETKQTRRHFLAGTAAAAGVITILPYAARAASHSNDVFMAGGGDIKVHPISHASFVMETPAGTIYSDPVGEASAYADFPAPDLILVTHEHGDHYKAETLIANGGSTEFNGVKIDAIPAYNLTEERKKFHPQGRDNGYVLTFDGFRVYISGDTEDIPEMRALENIDLAFVCMNLPFTMDAKAAASAVAEFKPKYVYPYHYRGRDGGTQDPAEFAKLVGDAAQVRMGDWYKDA